jgi:hypothetical protein
MQVSSRLRRIEITSEPGTAGTWWNKHNLPDLGPCRTYNRI